VPRGLPAAMATQRFSQQTKNRIADERDSGRQCTLDCSLP
jgi:hypothetical protein